MESRRPSQPGLRYLAEDLDRLLAVADAQLASSYPGGQARGRQPVHTAYVPADRFGAGRRLTGLHYGTYDYSAAIGVSAAHQSLDHPAADYAKSVLQAAAAGTGVVVSDGSTNVLPVGSAAEVILARQSHARLVRRSLERGFYQGWDLHPGQLVSRYAATYGFYRRELGRASGRLRAYADRAEAGLEEPATGRALAGFLLRGLHCGAFAEAEVTALAGLGQADLQATARHGQVR